jgi:hypothetical protein
LNLLNKEAEYRRSRKKDAAIELFIAAIESLEEKEAKRLIQMLFKDLTKISVDDELFRKRSVTDKDRDVFWATIRKARRPKRQQNKKKK